MESAGAALCEALLKPPFQARELRILCGPGHNGGDGLVLARQAAARGLRVRVWRAPGKPKPLTEVQAKRLAAFGLQAEPGQETEGGALPPADWLAAGGAGVWLIEALRGLGQRPEPDERLKPLLAWLAEAEARGLGTCALDSPAGLAHPDSPWRPRQVLFLDSPRAEAFFPGARTRFGAWQVLNIGFPPLEPAALENPLRPWLADTGEGRRGLGDPGAGAHKFQRGHLGLVAGPPGLGAGYLAAQGAWAGGAGYQTWFLPEARQAEALALDPSVVLKAWPAQGCPEGPRAWVVGPGWTPGGEGGQADQARHLWGDPRPQVWDAGALDWLGSWSQPGGPRVLTPHPGEAERLTGLNKCGLLEDPRPLGDWARRRGVTLVFKASTVWVFGAEGQIRVLEGSNPWLGVAGSGDVLAGLTGALLAAGLPAFEAAWRAADWHQEAGALAAARGPFSARALPEALAALRSRKEER